MKFRIVATAATLMMVWCAAAVAKTPSDQTVGQEAAGQVSSASTATPGAELPELQYEFDAVVDGTEIKHDFKIRNTGDGPLSILQVKTG